MITYHGRYLSKLNSLEPVIGKDIAVLGCSFGVECNWLVEAGANSVMGFDIDPQIGKDYSHPRIKYQCQSITATNQLTGVFDIVYSVAVFEHIHDLHGAMAEAVRICKRGGLIFLLSSPIWFSPYGNHMISMLESLPWCHLLYSPSELRLKIIENYPAVGDDKNKLDQTIDRIFDPVYFNRMPPSVYLEAANKIHDVAIIENRLWPAVTLKPEYLNIYLPQCIDKGYVEKDLMIGAHFFCGNKV